MEDRRTITPWNEEHVPEEIVAQSPEPGYWTVSILVLYMTYVLVDYFFVNQHALSLFLC